MTGADRQRYVRKILRQWGIRADELRDYLDVRRPEPRRPWSSEEIDAGAAAAWAAFCDAFISGAHIPGEDRGKAAMRAAFRVGLQAVTIDSLELRRDEAIVAAVALKHDSTSAEIRGGSCLPQTLLARDEAAFELNRAGRSGRKIARLLGRKRHADVPTWIANHEARIAVVSAPEGMEVANGRQG